MDTMQIKTKEGTDLVVSIGDYRGAPTIEFRYQAGGLCSSYYVGTFNAVSDGLCLDGRRWEYQSIDAETVAQCKAWVATQLD